MKSINICYLINKRFLPLTLTSIDYVKKFFRAHDRYHLKFYIIGIDQFDVPCDINFILSPRPDLPILWQRAFIPDVLREDKVIFLDSDTIILTCISKLWETNLHGNTVGVVQHQILNNVQDMITCWDMNFEPFNRYNKRSYFNCGVMVINQERWRQACVKDKFFDILDTYIHTEWKNWDEPAFNIALIDDCFYMNKLWNHKPGEFVRPYIIHYYGDNCSYKPDHNSFNDVKFT